ncbi:MAG: hypothetical protein JSU07_11415 [Bacteroidetes bacterium]|nr:hypothetical protein [Bacteroidota bacterium]
MAKCIKVDFEVKKALTTRFILVVIIFNLFISPLFIYEFQNWIKYEVKSELASALFNENLIELTFNAKQFSNLNWIDKEEEFLYNQKYYDVKSISYCDNGSVIIKAYSDVREDNFAEVIKENSHSKSAKTPITSVFNFMLLCYLQNSNFNFSPSNPKCLPLNSTSINYKHTFNMPPFIPPKKS